jgi:hypothetical protein
LYFAVSPWRALPELFFSGVVGARAIVIASDTAALF